MNEDWNRIYDSPQTVKRFLKEYQSIKNNICDNYDSVYSYEIDNRYNRYNTPQYYIENSFNLFVYDFGKVIEDIRPKLTKKEWRDLCLWVYGFNEQEIADYYNTQREGIHCRIMSVSKKIIKRWKMKNGTKKLVS